MPLNLIITGVGGQGNVLASQILGRAAVRKNLKVTIGETFGLSQRGGPVMSHIRFSRERTYGPLIPPNMANIILGLEPLETLRIVMEYGNERTIYLVNSRPVYPLNVIAGDVEYPKLNWIKDILTQSGEKLYWLDATQCAVKLGGPVMLNMVMLGALCSFDHFPLDITDIEGVLEEILPPSKVEANSSALNSGRGMILRGAN